MPLLGGPGPPYFCNLDGHEVLLLRRKGATNGGWFYKCTGCNGTVGAHQQRPYAPLGTIADEETKRLRTLVHKTIDPLWKNKDKAIAKKRRHALYQIIGERLGIKEYHTGEADADQCRTVIKLAATITMAQVNQRSKILKDDEVGPKEAPPGMPFEDLT